MSVDADVIRFARDLSGVADLSGEEVTLLCYGGPGDVRRLIKIGLMKTRDDFCRTRLTPRGLDIAMGIFGEGQRKSFEKHGIRKREQTPEAMADRLLDSRGRALRLFGRGIIDTRELHLLLEGPPESAPPAGEFSEWECQEKSG